jgi:transcriptional regulator with XRE-family HTH domain
MKRIGDMLRAVRQQRKLTLREVAERSRIFAQERGDDSYRISSSWLGRLEREQHELTLNKLIVLAEIYNVKPEELLGSGYPDSLGIDQPPDETSLVSPESGPSSMPYRWAFIGKRDRTLEPLIPAGSVVQIDTRRREIPPHKEWAHPLQRPLYFLKTRDAYFCGWCELDPLGELLTLVPHPLSPVSNRTWKYPEDVEIMGRIIAVTTRFTPAT